MPESTKAIDCLFDYLSMAGEGPVSGTFDWVIGFGHFDLVIPQMCGEAVTRGQARQVAFTGGIGAGTADLGMPEADAFHAELLRHYPKLAGTGVLCETRSTNTGENVQFLLSAFGKLRPPVSVDSGLDSVLVIATPIRLRRVVLTVRRFLPRAHIVGRCPERTWIADRQLHEAKGVSWLWQLTGEVTRINDYSARGWIAPAEIPEAVLAAAASIARQAMAAGGPCLLTDGK